MGAWQNIREIMKQYLIHTGIKGLSDKVKEIEIIS